MDAALREEKLRKTKEKMVEMQKRKEEVYDIDIVKQALRKTGIFQEKQMDREIHYNIKQNALHEQLVEAKRRDEMRQRMKELQDQNAARQEAQRLKNVLKQNKLLNENKWVKEEAAQVVRFTK